ncbi:MAG: tRNA lysidine(34) synthetase TilS [Acidobacteriota bacterium]
MGSSPVTATIISQKLKNVFGPAERVVVAFSGGPDSTALLLSLVRLGLPGFRVTAAHLDHGLDPGSADRAEAASRLADQLGVRFVGERREVVRLPSESLEAAARRVRYGFLEEVRLREGARWIATAHHRDDQAETVLLRLLFGSGWEGLGGIRPVRGSVVRPLLDVPREDLLKVVEEAGLAPVRDPTNLDLAVPRNRIRHRILPGLAAADLLARVAERARGASERLGRHLSAHLNVEEVEDGIAVAGLERLPPEVLAFALAWLHRRAGAPYPAGGAARSELLRQVRGGARVACDCGGGWRWEDDGGRLVLRRPVPGEEPVPHFSYTVPIPGGVEIPEIAVRVGLSRRPVEPWMFVEGSARRAGLALPLAAGDRITVRNRRPGDRIHPLGAAGSRKLKDLLIDRRVPRRERERLPLICVGEAGETIAWVPGVAIDQRFRITGESTVWLSEITETT